MQWAPDSKTLAPVSTSRGRKHECFRIADARTGAVRTVFEYSDRTYYHSGIGAVNWRYRPVRHEAIWYSERNNWSHLYLYNLKTGRPKHAIATGHGNVIEVLHVARRTGTIWFRGVGRTAGINPYYQQFWKVGLNASKRIVLTPEPCDHLIGMSPDGRYFIDSCFSPEPGAGHDAALVTQRPDPGQGGDGGSLAPESRRPASTPTYCGQDTRRQD